MDKLAEHGPIIVQSVVSFALVGAIIAMQFMRMEVPKEMWAIAGIAVGHWFGSDSAKRLASTARALAARN